MSAPSRHKVATTSQDESTPQVGGLSCLRLDMEIQDIVRLVRLLEEIRPTLRPQVEPVHHGAGVMTPRDERAWADVHRHRPEPSLITVPVRHSAC